MSEPSHLLGMYLHLARAAELRKRPLVRDRLLILAGMIAARMQLSQIAAYCRHKILEHNPGHLVRRWTTLAVALEDEDFLHFLKQVQRRFPQEKAEVMMASLGIQMGREREAYFSDYEYAASLMGTTPAALDEMFGAAD